MSGRKTSHPVPPVHKYGSLKAGDVDPLLELPVQGLGVAASGAHPVGHVHPPLVMVNGEQISPHLSFLNSHHYHS